MVAKLYRSAVHHDRWIASVPGLGWYMFPARENGWEDRQPARGIDPLYLREAPARLAARAGFPLHEQAPELDKVA